MNNIIIQTIRVGGVLGIALFAFVSNAFAAPTLTPVEVINITGTTATLDGYVINPGRNSIVWFEWSEGSSVSAPYVVARQGLYNEAGFRWHLRDLTPGVTYSYRAVAMDGGVTVYSPVGSFKTPTTSNTISESTTYQLGQTSSPLGNSSVGQPVAPTPVVAQAPVQTTTNKKTAPAAETKKVVAPVTEVKTEGFTNNNAAAIIGAGDGMLPGTLIGWTVLFIAMLVMLLVALMIYETTEKRNLALAKKKPEDKEEEHK